jgi:hypothetical protein
MTADYNEAKVVELLDEMAKNIEIEIELGRHVDLSKPFGTPAPQPDRTREHALLAAPTPAEKVEFEKRREARAYDCYSDGDYRRKGLWGNYWFREEQ